MYAYEIQVVPCFLRWEPGDLDWYHVQSAPMAPRPYIALYRLLPGRPTIYNIIAYIVVRSKTQNSGSGFRKILRDIGTINQSGFLGA